MEEKWKIPIETPDGNSIKIVYHISGFDCASCATEVEEHLNSKKEIEFAKIDFSANKLYITYKNNPWTLQELINIIKEVESDPLEIYEESNTSKIKRSLSKAHTFKFSRTRAHTLRGELIKKKTIKKVYHISGFDCASCATQTELHLNQKDEIFFAKIDFSANKMYITYTQNILTVEELKKIIAEIESDPLVIYEEKITEEKKNNNVIKKVYHISGFDCGNCATQVEENLKTKEDISFAKIDFTANKMYISYRNDPWSIDEVKKAIAEVESDPITVYEEAQMIQAKEGKKKTQKICTNSMIFTLIRVAFGVVMAIICVFVLGKKKYNWVRFGLYLGTFCFLAYDIFWKVILHIKTRINILDHNLLLIIAGIGAFALYIFHLVKFEKHRDDILFNLGNNYTIALDEGMDAVLVVVLFQVGHVIETVATNKSKAAVMKAVELRVETANMLKDGNVIQVSPEDLSIGDKIVVKVGELIPVDGIVIEGNALVDTSSLTGEFIPESTKIGKEVFSGCLIKEGQIIVEVKKKYSDSAVSKIVDLISLGDARKSKADELVDKFSRYYTPIVVIVAILEVIIFGCATKKWDSAICQGLEVLVAGCPCSIVISVPLAYFSAIGLASKNGIIIKGASFLDKIRGMKKLTTDKTGTITKGSFSIQIINPYNCSKEELLDNLYIIESLSNHPIAKAIIGEQYMGDISGKIKNYEEKAGYGVSGNYEGRFICAGTKAYLELLGIQVIKAKENGTVIYLGVNKKFMGYAILADEIKDNSKKMVELLHKEKVEIILLTGDREENAREISEKINIDRYYSNLLPEQKLNILEEEMNNKTIVAFVGDGINDAPSIKRSDIGIAMGGIGSDIAVENADIVIMNDDPIKIYVAMKISKIALHVVIFNIVFSLIVKVGVLVLINIQEFADHFDFPMYFAVLADTGLTVLMVLNSLFILYRKIKY